MVWPLDIILINVKLFC